MPAEPVRRGRPYGQSARGLGRRGASASLWRPEPVDAPGDGRSRPDRGRPRRPGPGRPGPSWSSRTTPTSPRFCYDKCHDKGFKCLAAPSGEAGLQLAQDYAPDAAILDLHLPGLDGWSVLESMKEDTRTRHIPVHIMSVEQASARGPAQGGGGPRHQAGRRGQQLDEAFAKLEQVAAQGTKRVLVVEDDPQLRRQHRLPNRRRVTWRWTRRPPGRRPWRPCARPSYDCIVLDLGLPDMDGRQMLATLQRRVSQIPPVIVLHRPRHDPGGGGGPAARTPSRSSSRGCAPRSGCWTRCRCSCTAWSARCPPASGSIIRNLHEGDEPCLAGKKVLVVDDDMRTTFAVAALLSGAGHEGAQGQQRPEGPGDAGA